MKTPLLLLTMVLGVVLTVHLAMNGKVGAALNNARVGNVVFWCIGAAMALLIGLTGWQSGALERTEDRQSAAADRRRLWRLARLRHRLADPAGRRRAFHVRPARRSDHQRDGALALRLARFAEAADHGDEPGRRRGAARRDHPRHTAIDARAPGGPGSGRRRAALARLDRGAVAFATACWSAPSSVVRLRQRSSRVDRNCSSGEINVGTRSRP